MNIRQATLDAVRALRRLEPGERVEISHAGGVLTTRAPEASTHPLLILREQTGPTEILRQLVEAASRTTTPVESISDWKPDWNLATIPDSALYSEAARRRASRRNYKRQAQPPVEPQSVSE